METSHVLITSETLPSIRSIQRTLPVQNCGRNIVILTEALGELEYFPMIWEKSSVSLTLSHIAESILVHQSFLFCNIIPTLLSI